MTVSWTQTYGNERVELLEIYSRDSKLIEFKNLFDLNIYSFHNCDASIVSYFNQINPVNNTLVLEFNGIDYPNYTDTVVEILKKLKEIGCTHFFFNQDDAFSANNENLDCKELFDYMKSFSSDFMLNLTDTANDLMERKSCQRDNDPYVVLTPELHNSFTVYNSTVKDFRNAFMLAMGDNSYICTGDLPEKMYDANYIAQKNIWTAEQILAISYFDGTFNEDGKAKFMNRFVTDKCLFKNYNLYGNGIILKDEYRQELIQKGLL